MLLIFCAGVGAAGAAGRGALGVGALLVVVFGAGLLLFVLLLLSAAAPAAHMPANTALRTNAVILAIFYPPCLIWRKGIPFRPLTAKPWQAAPSWRRAYNLCVKAKQPKQLRLAALPFQMLNTINSTNPILINSIARAKESYSSQCRPSQMPSATAVPLLCRRKNRSMDAQHGSLIGDPLLYGQAKAILSLSA